MGSGDVRNGMMGHTGRRRARVWWLAPVLALGLAGCAGNGIGGGNGNEGPMGTGNAGDQGLFGSTMQTTTVEQNPAGGGTSGMGTAAVTPGDPGADALTCPPVQVRAGAAAWQVTEPQDGGVRYQATLGQFSRECRFTSPDMNMRVGIQGRVLLGPKGGPGKVTVPIRLAVVEEGPAPKTVWTKFYSVPVEVGPNVMQVDFGLVADDVNFPRPTPALSERYVLYVGFDPQGKEEKPARPARTQTQKPRPAPAASATPRQTAPAATAQPRQVAPAASQPATVPATSAAPRTSTSAPTSTVQSAPATTAPAASAPTAAPDNSQTQWIGAPAPSTGGFSQ